MRNPYEYPNEWEAGGDPGDEDRVIEPSPQCRACQSVEGPFNYFNGWPWCRETCYRQITALHMEHFSRGLPVTEADAEEHFAQRRRI